MSVAWKTYIIPIHPI